MFPPEMLTVTIVVGVKVNYQERYSAAGRIPRTGLRREMGPTSREMAAAQLMESALEPLFEPGFASRCQVGPCCLLTRATSADMLAQHSFFYLGCR